MGKQTKNNAPAVLMKTNREALPVEFGLDYIQCADAVFYAALAVHCEQIVEVPAALCQYRRHEDTTTSRNKMEPVAVIEDEWKSLYTEDNDIVAGFHPEYKVLFFTNGSTSNFLVYDMVARSWMKGTGVDRISDDFKSKFFVYSNSLVTASTNATTANQVDFKKWDEVLSDDLTNASPLTWKSKEFDFGNPSTVKFVYKVYITYKTSDDAAGVEMVAYHNDGTGVSSTTLTGTLANTSGEWNTIELIPTPRISCKTIELQLQQIASTVVDSGFEVNDLVIIYREKSVR